MNSISFKTYTFSDVLKEIQQSIYKLQDRYHIVNDIELLIPDYFIQLMKLQISNVP